MSPLPMHPNAVAHQGAAVLRIKLAVWARARRRHREYVSIDDPPAERGPERFRATPPELMRLTTRSLVEHEGKTLTIAALAERHGLTPLAVLARLRSGMSIRQAVAPVRAIASRLDPSDLWSTPGTRF